MKLTLELDSDLLNEGKCVVVKEINGLCRRGQVDLHTACDLLNQVFQWEAGNRKVEMLTWDQRKHFFAFGQNGHVWRAILDIEPDAYYLIGESGKTYYVQFPRLVAVVGNHQYPKLFWTKANHLSLKSVVYPLAIGNVDSRGNVCLGNTGLVCRRPEEALKFVRQVIEAPSTSHYNVRDNDALFARLEQQWDSSIGSFWPRTVADLLQMRG